MVTYGVKDNVAKIENLIFCPELWTEKRVREFAKRYKSQFENYETIVDAKKVEKQLQYVDNNIIETLGKFKMPFEFTFVALTEGRYNNVYYRAEDLKASCQTLVGKPITIDHSKSVRDVIGEIKSVTWNAAKKRIEGIGVIRDKEIAEKIDGGLIKGVSVEVMIDYVKTKFGQTAADPEFIALSIVKDPACDVPKCGINVE